jgi:hypothetical protein
VIYDDNSIIAAVSKVWPNAFIKRCEYHIREGARRKMKP